MGQYVNRVEINEANYALASGLYGTCSTAADTAAKVVTCSDFDTIRNNVTIHVKFTYSNTATNPTLNVNSTGAKTIYRYGTTAPGTTADTSWQAGAIVSFTYDGTYWVMNDVSNNDAVTQTADSTSDQYEVLFSGTADNTTRTEGVKKDSGFLFNPNLDAVTVGTRLANSSVGQYSIAMGEDVTASGNKSFAVGNHTAATLSSDFAEGAYTTASGAASHAEGYYSASSGNQSHAEGYYATASGHASHAENNHTTASGNYSHAEGAYTTAAADYSHADGRYTIAQARGNHVFGEFNIADPTGGASQYGTYIEIVGNGTGSSDRSNARTLDWSGNEWLQNSLTVGYKSSSGTVGNFSLRQGYNNIASGVASTAEGYSTTASGDEGHAEGESTTASGAKSHAEGYGTTASGTESHAEGNTTTASGNQSHAEGAVTTASGTASHAEGVGTIAQRSNNHVFGKYNVADTGGSAGAAGTFIELVGNGTADNARSNARTLDWDGNETLAGNLTLAGSTSDINLTGTNSTWDGTNTSLKDAIAALSARITALGG